MKDPKWIYNNTSSLFFVDKPFQDYGILSAKTKILLHVRGAVIVINVRLCASFCMHCLLVYVSLFSNTCINLSN